MSDLWRSIIGGAREVFGKIVREARTADGVRRRAGRYERRAIRAKSSKRRDRLNRIAKQLREQAERMDKG